MVLRECYRRVPLRGIEPYLRGDSGIVLCAAPLVLHLYDWMLWSDDGALLPLLHRYEKQPVHLLLSFSWERACDTAVEDRNSINWLAEWHARHLHKHPNHRIIYLANTEPQRDRLRAAGFDAVFVSQNALVSPETYRPLADAVKRFDAVYDARILPYKRHQLASRVPRLALVTARTQGLFQKGYTRQVRDWLAHAHWFNDPLDRGYRYLLPDEVNACVNQAWVGLCLSAEEGAMFASIQYLLAGLPVVSTRSIGGRDVFFEDDYACIVDDDPDAVAEGVARICRQAPPAHAIRERVMRKIGEHRARLLDVLHAIVGDGPGAADLSTVWARWGAHPAGTGPISAAGMLAKVDGFARPTAGI
ncbi:MAG TPA: glycosyltransferase [Burkholderiaceae bacterium]